MINHFVLLLLSLSSSFFPFVLPNILWLVYLYFFYPPPPSHFQFPPLPLLPFLPPSLPSLPPGVLICEKYNCSQDTSRPCYHGYEVCSETPLASETDVNDHSCSSTYHANPVTGLLELRYKGCQYTPLKHPRTLVACNSSTSCHIDNPLVASLASVYFCCCGESFCNQDVTFTHPTQVSTYGEPGAVVWGSYSYGIVLVVIIRWHLIVLYLKFVSILWMCMRITRLGVHVGMYMYGCVRCSCNCVCVCVYVKFEANIVQCMIL